MIQNHKLTCLSVTIAIAVAALIFTAGPAQAVCCNANIDGVCGDGTDGTPCCGYGKCNIFCCNCDGGCRKGCTPADSQEKFNSIDTDHDGKISPAELASWAKKAKKKLSAAALKQGFDKVDTDHSGFIEPGEFDKDLAGAAKQ